MSAMFSFAAGRSTLQSTTGTLARQTARGAAVLAVPKNPADVEDLPAHRAIQSPRGQHQSVATPRSWRDEFWRRVSVYKDVSERSFLSYQWSVSPYPNREKR